MLSEGDFDDLIDLLEIREVGTNSIVCAAVQVGRDLADKIVPLPYQAPIRYQAANVEDYDVYNIYFDQYYDFGMLHLINILLKYIAIFCIRYL